MIIIITIIINLALSRARRRIEEVTADLCRRRVVRWVRGCFKAIESSLVTASVEKIKVREPATVHA
jgi:hypothetical protein